MIKLLTACDKPERERERGELQAQLLPKTDRQTDRVSD